MGHKFSEVAWNKTDSVNEINTSNKTKQLEYMWHELNGFAAPTSENSEPSGFGGFEVLLTFQRSHRHDFEDT